jgi:predicted PhzF superfamily epimerase YddE/YHI9
MGKLAALNPIGITGVNVFGLYARGGSADIEVRSFAPGDGIPEDPVCGSGNGCVAALVRRDGVLKARAYVASQGRCLGVTVRSPSSSTPARSGFVATLSSAWRVRYKPDGPDR